MPRANDLSGRRFGRLLPLERFPGSVWRCRCDCGAIVTVAVRDLTTGNTKSCGCLRRDVSAALKATHGHTRNGKWLPPYRTWADMVNRCTNPNNHAYADYGGRGIRVCDEWRYDFLAFRDYMGPKPTRPRERWMRVQP